MGAFYGEISGWYIGANLLWISLIFIILCRFFIIKVLVIIFQIHSLQLIQRLFIFLITEGSELHRLPTVQGVEWWQYNWELLSYRNIDWFVEYLFVNGCFYWFHDLVEITFCIYDCASAKVAFSNASKNHNEKYKFEDVQVLHYFISYPYILNR